MEVALPPQHSDFLDGRRFALERCIEYVSNIRANANKSGNDSGKCVGYVRFATLYNQLYRIALQCDLQLNETGPIIPSDPSSGHFSSSGGIAWRLSAECFSVVVSAVPADGISLPPGTTPPDDFLARVAAAHFELNQEKPVACLELVDDLNKRNYNSLLKHITNLLALYNVSGNKATRSRAYLCLQVMEQDMAMLSAAHNPDFLETLHLDPLNTHTMSTLSFRTPADVVNMAQSINGSLIGQLMPRSGGRFTALTFFVSATQEALAIARLIRPTVQKQPGGFGEKEQSDHMLLGGFGAFIGLRATTDGSQNSIPFMPLVNLIKNERDLNTAQFVNADSVKCFLVTAEFFLSLQPPLLMDSEVIEEIKQITGIPVAETNNLPPESLHRLLLRRHNQEALDAVDVHLALPNKSQHVYHTNTSPLRGYSVSAIAFTCPNQLPALIRILRRQANWLSFADAFLIHPRNPTIKDEELSYKFDVSMPSRQKFIVKFQHPLAVQRIVQVNIELDVIGVQSTSVIGALVSNSKVKDLEYYNPMRILSRSHNLPVSLTWLLIRLGCPVQPALCCMFPGTSTDIVEAHCQSITPTIKVEKVSSTFPLKKIRDTCLNRARSALSFCSDDADADGVLSGADQISIENLSDAKEMLWNSSTSLGYDPFSSWTASSRTSIYQSMTRQPTSSLPPGVMAATPSPGYLFDQIKTEETFSAPCSVSCSQQNRPPPPPPPYSTIIPGTLSVSALSSCPSAMMKSMKSAPYVQIPISLSSPSLGQSFKPQMISSSASQLQQAALNNVPSGSMLVSLLDEDVPQQNLPPSHVSNSMARVVTTTSFSQPSNLQSSFLNLNSSSGICNGGLNNSDVLSNLLISQSDKDSGGVRTTRGLMSSSSITSPKLSSNNSMTARVGPDPTVKRARKRRINSTESGAIASVAIAANSTGQFISSLPTRSFIVENIKQPGTGSGCVTESTKQAVVQKATTRSSSSGGPGRVSAAVVSNMRMTNSTQVAKSVYDFEDAPVATSMAALAKAPLAVSSGVMSNSSFTISPVASTLPMVSASVSSTIPKLVIKTNRGASAVSVTASATTVSKMNLGSGSMVGSLSKPKKVVEGKPDAFIKQMRSDKTTVFGKVKKDRKRRVSSKKSDSGQHMILSIPSPSAAANRKLVTCTSRKLTHSFTTSTATPLPTLSVKSKNRKKTTSTSSVSLALPFVVKPPSLLVEPVTTANFVSNSEGSNSALTSRHAIPSSASSSSSLSAKMSAVSSACLPPQSKKAKNDENPASDVDTPSKGTGLIKGYKIPKRKVPSPIHLSSVAQIPILFEDNCDNGLLEVAADASMSSMRVDLEVPVTPTSALSIPTPTSLTSAVPTTPTSHKPANRKLLDIVDQLRAAKSAAGPLANVETVTLRPKPPGLTIAEETTSLTGAVTGDSAADALIISPSSPSPVELTPTDSTDNIFEKFSSSTTPTKAASDSSKWNRNTSEHIAKSPTAYDPNDPLLLGSEEERERESLTTIDSGQTTPINNDALSDTIIKDTPDSPAESTSKSVVSTSGGSKIIPVSRKISTSSSNHSFFKKSSAVSRTGCSQVTATTSISTNLRGAVPPSAGPRFNDQRGSWTARSFGPGMPRGPNSGFGSRGWSPTGCPPNPNQPINWPMRPQGLYRGDGSVRFPGPLAPPVGFMPSLPGGPLNRPMNKK